MKHPVNRILVVDSKNEFTATIEDILKAHVDSVTCCEEAKIALSYVGAYDLVIISLTLIRENEENGLDCLREIRKQWKCLPVIVVTDTCDDLKDEAMEAGADDYVPLDVMRQVLGYTIDSAIKRRQGNLQIEETLAKHRAMIDQIAL